MARNEYRKVTLMQGNKEISSLYVKFVNGTNAETITFKNVSAFSSIVTSIVISEPLPIV